MKRRVRVTVTGYYWIDRSTMERYYGTTDWDAALDIDRSNARTESEAIDFMRYEPTSIAFEYAED